MAVLWLGPDGQRTTMTYSLVVTASVNKFDPQAYRVLWTTSLVLLDKGWSKGHWLFRPFQGWVHSDLIPVQYNQFKQSIRSKSEVKPPQDKVL